MANETPLINISGKSIVVPDYGAMLTSYGEKEVENLVTKAKIQDAMTSNKLKMEIAKQDLEMQKKDLEKEQLKKELENKLQKTFFERRENALNRIIKAPKGAGRSLLIREYNNSDEVSENGIFKPLDERLDVADFDPDADKTTTEFRTYVSTAIGELKKGKSIGETINVEGKRVENIIPLTIDEGLKDQEVVSKAAELLMKDKTSKKTETNINIKNVEEGGIMDKDISQARAKAWENYEAESKKSDELFNSLGSLKSSIPASGTGPWQPAKAAVSDLLAVFGMKGDLYDEQMNVESFFKALNLEQLKSGKGLLSPMTEEDRKFLINSIGQKTNAREKLILLNSFGRSIALVNKINSEIGKAALEKGEKKPIVSKIPLMKELSTSGGKMKVTFDDYVDIHLDNNPNLSVEEILNAWRNEK